MRITVFGAAGSVGRRVVAEASLRGHEVTAVTRAEGDATNTADVARLSAGQDVVITTTRPKPGQEPELVTAIKAVLAGIPEGTRLLVVGGAASLTTASGRILVEEPGFPEELRPIALACSEQLDVCRADTTVDWAYLSPPMVLEPGTRTGNYRVGADDLLVDQEGNSAISMEDFAVALIDEAERPKHHRTRFTVAY